MLQAGTDLFSLHRPNQVRGFEAATKATPPSRRIEVGSLQNRRNFRHSKAEPRDASSCSCREGGEALKTAPVHFITSKTCDSPLSMLNAASRHGFVFTASSKSSKRFRSCHKSYTAKSKNRSWELAESKKLQAFKGRTT